MRCALIFSMVLCSGAAFAQYAGPALPASVSNVRFSTVASGDQSQATHEGLVDLETQNQYEEYWRKWHGSLDTLPRNIIDWNRERYVAIHLGTRESGGYAVDVTRMNRKIGVAQVTATETLPARGQVVTGGPTSPWVLVKVERGAFSFALTLEKATPNFFFPDNNGVVMNLGGGATLFTTTDLWRPCKYQGNLWDGYADPGIYEITDLSAMQQFWMDSHGGDLTDMPDGVDWNTERVVIVAGGLLPNGTSISVDDVTVTGGLGTIRAKQSFKDPQENADQMRKPYAIIKVSRQVPVLRLKWLRAKKSSG